MLLKSQTPDTLCAFAPLRETNHPAPSTPHSTSI